MSQYPWCGTVTRRKAAGVEGGTWRPSRSRCPPAGAGCGNRAERVGVLISLMSESIFGKASEVFVLDVDCSHLLFTVDVQVSSPPYMFLFLSINNVIMFVRCFHGEYSKGSFGHISRAIDRDVRVSSLVSEIFWVSKCSGNRPNEHFLFSPFRALSGIMPESPVRVHRQSLQYILQ